MAVPIAIGVVLKDAIGWIWSMVKITISDMNVAAKIKIIFSKRNRKVFFDIMLILFYSGLLVKLATDAGVASRFEILLMVGCVMIIFFMFISLLWNLVQASNERKKSEIKE